MWLTLQCIDVRQAKHSHDMEHVGFLKAMEDLMQLGLNIEVVIDDYVQIRSIMRVSNPTACSSTECKFACVQCVSQ